MFSTELELRNLALARINEKLSMAVETARVFMGCRNLNELYHKVLEEFAANLCAQGGSLFLVRSDRLERIHSLDPRHVPEDIFFPLPEKSVFHQVMERKCPVLIRDIDSRSDTTASGWHGYKNSSALVIPLLDNDEVLRGIVSLHDKDDPPFAQHDQGFALLLASFASEVLRSLQAAQDLNDRQEQFRTVIEEAEESNRLKSEFLANVSHEIRTPLNCIMGFAEIILSCHSVPVIHDKALTILKESHILLNLINDILDHAKIESGKLQQECYPLDLHRLLEDIAVTGEMQARTKFLDFRIEMSLDVPQYVLGDGIRIRQVLTNLVNNAVKFTEEGSVILCASLLKHEKKTAHVRFEVRDTGIGIPKDKQESIFCSFTQADGSTTRKYGGSGLGTTIARELVLLMDGQMGLESEPGKGSRFWFKLPLRTTECSPEAADFYVPDYVSELQGSAQFASNGFSPRDRGKPSRILLAEDYPPNQEVAWLHLDSAGHRVEIVDNGYEAVRACKNERFDLILLDIQMPEMDGYEVARTIRSSDEINSETPILGLTAHAHESARRACLDAGMNDVVTKPIRREPFLDAVNKWALSAATKQVLVETENRGASQLAGEEPPLNIQQATEEFAGNTMLLQGVLRQFLAVADSQIEAMKNATENDDRETIRREAHKIRGGASNLTASSLSTLAEALETSSEEQPRSVVEGLINDVSLELTRLRDFCDRNNYI